MPTIFTHAVAATALGQPYPAHLRSPRFWFWTVTCSMLPDVDVIGFGFGIRYGDFLGHRGFTHSLLFAAIVGMLVGRGRGWLSMYFALITASHGVFDAMTDGGLGIAFFSPFDTTRYFFPWRPLRVSPIGPGFFSGRALVVLTSELRWIWLPSAVLALAAWAWRRRTK
jgi:inner membrane protein